MPACPAFDPLAPYLVGTLDFVECHARALGEEGYRALGWGSPVGAIITGLITIYIALIGYRMLFGDLPSAREAVVGAARIGLVLALATQWPTYQVLIYGIVVDEPTSLANRVLAPGGLGGDEPRTLLRRSQNTYDAINALVHPEVDATRTNAQTVEPTNDNAGAQPTLPPTASPIGALTPAEITSLNGAQSAFVMGTLGGLLSTRVVAGILLALGPLFVAFLLFEATIGLFIGWLRILIATVIGGVGVLAVLAIELAILSPQIAALQRALANGLTVPALVDEISATATLFALLLAATLLGALVAALGLRVPGKLSGIAGRFLTTNGNGQAVLPRTEVAPTRTTSEANNSTRSQRLVSAIGQLERRDMQLVVAASGSSRMALPDRLGSTNAPVRVEPIGQSGRRTARRSSNAARQRDGQS